MQQRRPASRDFGLHGMFDSNTMACRQKGWDHGLSYPLYTVESAASALGLHAKTVLRYIREGRLPAQKVGKAYRIGHDELEAFAGMPLRRAFSGPALRTTSITDVAGIDVKQAQHLATALQTAILSRDHSAEPINLQTAFDPAAGVFKIVGHGSPADIGKLLELIEMHATMMSGPRKSV